MASGAAANDFGRNWLKEREARLLHEAGYPCPPAMKLPGGGWRLSQMGIPVPPIPTADRRWAEIYAVRDELTAEQQEDPAWHPENSSTWVPFFEDRHERQLNDFPGPKDLAPSRNNSEGRKDWWGVPGRSLQAVLDHIEGGNEPPLQGPARRGRRHGWEPRRMALSSSSSSSAGARSSTPLASVIKQEPAAPSRGIVIREPGTGGGSGSSSRLLTPKREPGTGVVGRSLKKAFRKKAVVKEEPYDEEAAMAAAMAASLDDVPPAPVDFALAWSARDHEREEEERKRRVEAEQREAFARYGRRGRRASPEVVVLDDDDEEAGTSTSRWLTPKQEPGTGGDGEAGRAPAPPSYGGGGDSSSDDGEDYTVIYKRLGL